MGRVEVPRLTIVTDVPRSALLASLMRRSRPIEEVPRATLLASLMRRPWLVDKVPRVTMLVSIMRRPWHVGEVARASLMSRPWPVEEVPRAAHMSRPWPVEEVPRAALMSRPWLVEEVPRAALMRKFRLVVGAPMPILFVALALLSSLMPCAGLERLFAASEITVPRRLLPRGDTSMESQLYAITFWGEKHFIYLEKQRFVPVNFRMYINGQPDASPVYLKRFMVDCYYQGYVLDSPNSAATLKTCTGLRGMVEFANVSYVIEPFRFLQGFKHLLHRLDTRIKDNMLFTDSDTDLPNNRTVQHPMPLNTYLATPGGQTTRFMEMAVFVTKDLFDSFGASTSIVIDDMMQLISYLNTRFSPLDIRIFMSSLDIWTDSNQVDLSSGNTSEKLDRFMYWIQWTWPKPKHYDIPVLFSYESKKMDRGLIYFGKMCSQKNGALIVYPSEQGIEKFSSLVAHMLGHNIGLMHDDYRDCQCSGTACIMSTNITNMFGTATLSSCSVADFGKFISTFGATCLLNEPILREPFNPRICGNRIIDDGEACDCGTPAQCLADPCCDSTCQFKESAKCSWGACCKDCQILPLGTLCGAKIDECDFPEFCDGISPVCPVDVFQQDGNTCSDDKWYCYKGKCQNPDTQCRTLFGEASQRADASCFVRANVQHDRFGNCGFFTKGSYFGCSVEDAMCGKLQCTYSKNVPFKSLRAPIIYYSSNSSLCTSIDLLQNSELTDPAFVSDGTKCDHDKLCLQQKCVHISVLEMTCSAYATCSGHGLCNNKGRCQCSKGWAPPTCKYKATRAFPDLDERMIRLQKVSSEYHYSLIIGLSITIPLVIIIIVVAIKRDAIRRCGTRQSERDESYMEEQSSISPMSSVTSV